jgi:hypothetical protein
MKYIFIISCFFAALTASAQKQFVVDPDAVLREVSGTFTSIKVSSGIKVYLSQSENAAIAVSASQEKYRDDIVTEISNNELHISYPGERIHNSDYKKMTVYVSFKNLTELHVSGASDIFIAGTLDVPQLSIHMSGASGLKGTVKINELNIKLSGASDVKLAGNVHDLNIESSGASDVKSYDLMVQNANIKVSGASDVNISVAGELSANASGASNVHYKGLAELKVKQSSGASSIVRVE